MENWLVNAVKVYGDHTAILTDREAISYSDLLLKVINIKISIEENLKPNKAEKIAILLENRIDYVIVIHAFTFLDAIPVMINTRLTSKEIKWQFETVNISKVIVSEKTKPALNNNYFDNLTFYSVDHFADYVKFSSLQNKNIGSHFKNSLDLNKIQSLIYTSGTTGKPKPATIKFSNIWANSQGSAERLGIDKNDIWMLTLPLYHVGGLSIIFRSCINGTTIFLDYEFNVNRIIDRINKYNITIISLVPNMLRRLLKKDKSSNELSKLRLILLGGDRIDISLVESCLKLNLQIAITYGMTESVSQVATALSSTVYKKPLSVGKSLQGIEVKIINENGLLCDNGQVGELVITGSSVIDGYYNVSSDKFTDMGFFTGDIGYIDDDGDIFILQRRVDLIISGGENIYPSEIETHIKSIERVQDACVIGIDDIKWGQIPVVLVQTDNDMNLEEIIISSCKENLAPYKIPKKIYFVKEFPRNSLGKLNRLEIRRLLDKL